MRVLLWHVHGSYATALLAGRHDYLLPVLPDRGPDGLGRARTWQWPATAVERTPAELATDDVDVVILQRPHEAELAARWLGRRPGVDVPAVYLEHNTPDASPTATRHPMADQRAVPIVHVTWFNALFWDNGTAPVRVVEHGVIDPGYRYTGTRAAAALVANDPLRRGRTVGADLLADFDGIPLDVFGMRVLGLAGGRVTAHEDLPQDRLHAELGARRCYLHLTRWTSLGLSLIEAMTLGMPVVALGTTEAAEAVPPEAGTVSTDPRRLVAATRRLLGDPDLARAQGAAARRVALARYGLDRFLADWDAVLEEATCSRR